MIESARSQVSDTAECAWILRWWLLALVLSGAAIALSIIMLARPVYEATAKVLPAQASNGDTTSIGSLGALAGIAGLDLASPSSVKFEALEILQSTAFSSSFIEDNGLLVEFYAHIWDGESQEWDLPWWGREPTIADASRLFREKILHVREDRRTTIISIGVKWHDREKAALWANAIIARLNAEMRARVAGNAEASLAYLNAQAEKTKYSETRQAVYRLIEAEVKKAMLAEVRKEFALRTIDPALAPQESDKIWPKPILVLAGGVSLGILMAMILLAAFRLILLLRSLKSKQESHDVLRGQ